MRKTLLTKIKEKLATNPEPCWTGSNSALEREFAEKIRRAGGVAAKMGCPDVGIFGEDRCLKAVVEVKRDGEDPRTHQVVMVHALATLVPAFVWSPSEVVQFNRDGTMQSVNEDAIIRLIQGVQGLAAIEGQTSRSTA
jgi:hypothetical protein